jgi:Tfp pilus assembly protein PilO
VSAAVRLQVTSRTIAIFLLVVAALIAGAGWFVVVSPKRSDASTLAATIQLERSQLAASQHAQASGYSATAVRGVGEALPPSPAIPEVVDQLSKLARRAGVSLDNVAPQATLPGEGYVIVPLNVVVDGRYFGVERFLNLVRTQVRLDKSHVTAAGRLFDVQSVSLQQTEPAPTVSATLLLRTFYYSPTTTQAPATTTTDTTTTS